MADLPSRHPKVACFGLAGLPAVPSLGLVWPGPVLPALPATTTAAAQPPPAAEGGRLLLLARQARQAQARPSQGKAQQASQPSQGRLAWLPAPKHTNNCPKAGQKHAKNCTKNKKVLFFVTYFAPARQLVVGIKIGCKKTPPWGPWGAWLVWFGCASRARNPKGPKITPFCQQMGRQPTVLHDIKTIHRRILAQISPDRSTPQSHFCLPILDQKIRESAKC